MSTSKVKSSSSFNNQQKLVRLKKLRETIDWENKKERLHFLDQFHESIKNWTGEFPDLRDYFQPEQIECILMDSLDFTRGFLKRKSDSRGYCICEFVTWCGFKNEPEVDKNGKPLLHRTTIIHRVATHGYPRETKRFVDTISNLFKVYNKFDVNYIDESGLSHFHVAVMSGCYEVVKSFLELGQADPNCPPQNSLDPPLHLALTYKRKEVVELLLIHGADPNFLNNQGLTPLQNIIKQKPNNKRDSLAMMLFDCSNKKYHPVQVDTRDPDGSGNTLLHLTIQHGCDLFRLLLRKGANPSIVNKEGFTPMHSICASRGIYYLGHDLLRLSNKKYHPLLVNSLDKKGNTPLHLLAIHYESRYITQLIELLLRNGCDPNLANEEGSTPLHCFCKINNADCLESTNTLFNICGELNKTIQVDARDKSGRTPLQYAVVNFIPDVVEALLDRGADLSSFVFPEKYFGEKLEWCKERVSLKLTLASGAMSVVEKLQKRGYEFDRSDVLTIMKIFAYYELFEKSTDFEKSWCDDEDFVRVAKELTIVPSPKAEFSMPRYFMEMARALKDGDFVEQSPSLYDLLQLRPEEAVKTFTYEKYLKFSRFHYIDSLPERLRNACMLHLCDKITKGFFRSWALDYFWELVSYRLPLECCEMIIDESCTNEELYNICLATELNRLKDGEKNVQPDEVECVKKGPKRAKRAKKVPKAPKRQKTKE